MKRGRVFAVVALLVGTSTASAQVPGQGAQVSGQEAQITGQDQSRTDQPRIDQPRATQPVTPVTPVPAPDRPPIYTPGQIFGVTPSLSNPPAALDANTDRSQAPQPLSVVPRVSEPSSTLPPLSQPEAPRPCTSSSGSALNDPRFPGVGSSQPQRPGVRAEAFTRPGVGADQLATLVPGSRPTSCPSSRDFQLYPDAPTQPRVTPPQIGSEEP